MGAAEQELAEAAEQVDLVHFDDDGPGTRSDWVAREEPLELQLGAASLAVIMRTPGHDVELALGMLLTERVIATPEQVVSVRHCSQAESPEAADNVIRVTLAPEVEVDFEALRRNLYSSSGCGICGKATIENALAHAAPLDDPARFEPDFFYGLPDQLRSEQQVFAKTGGLHAAGLFAPDGRLLVLREDVGRHNAVDKVVGWAVQQERLPLAGHVLMVSGRISYEIVQKALAAQVPVVAAVSAPTSLAVGLAAESRMTLVAFLRGRGLNVYGYRQRVSG